MAITGDQRGQSQQTVAPTLDLTGLMAITGDHRGQSQQTMAPTLDLTGRMAITGDQRGQSQQTVAPTLDLTGLMAITGDQRGQSQQQVKYSERLKPTYYIQTEEPTIHGYILTLFFSTKMSNIMVAWEYLFWQVYLMASLAEASLLNRLINIQYRKHHLGKIIFVSH